MPSDVTIARVLDDPGRNADLPGRVTGARVDEDGTGRVTLEIEELREGDDVVCAPGSAVVALPLRVPVRRAGAVGAVGHGR